MAKSEFIISYVLIRMDETKPPQWSIRYYADGSVGLFWADKEIATHMTTIDLEDHISNLQLLRSSPYG